MGRVRRVRSAEDAPITAPVEEEAPAPKRGKGKAATNGEKSELAETLKEVAKRYGDQSISLASSVKQPTRISTRSFMLDFCTLGGIPANRVTMIAGERSAGKSTLSNLIISGAQAQYPDQQCVLIDIEGTHDTTWSEKLGVDSDRLHVFQPETGESAVDAADAFVRTRDVSLIVVDSIAALTPMKEAEGSAEDAHVGLQARLVGGMVRKLTSGLIAERQRRHYVTVLFLNQFRMKIGVMFGDPRTLPGGKALEFSTSLQVIMKNKEKMGKGDLEIEEVEENEHAFQITKNKLNGGPRTGEFRLRRMADPDIGLEEGDIDDAGTMLTYGKKFGVYTGGGSSWKLQFWDFDRTFRGLDDAKRYLYENRDDYWLLRNYLISQQAQRLSMPQDFIESFYPE